MVGREVIFRLEHVDVERGEPVLEVHDLAALNDKDVLALRGISFAVHEGEIFGVAGVSGNGQQVLAEVLAGLRKTVAGRVLMDGVDITRFSSLERWKNGMGYIPSDRIDVGSIGAYSLVENVLLNYYFDGTFSKMGIVDSNKTRKFTEGLISEYGIATPGPDSQARSLSGGNLQKLILARVLSRKPRLLIANLPTQGLDVGATEFVQNKLLEAKRQHAAILLISEDLDEVLSLSDRVAAIYEGEFMGVLDRQDAHIEHIGAMMAGLEQKVAQS
jgi:simple sugar transport system ATP-binding protein